MSILPGFVKGQSDNLPKIDVISMFSFLGTNPNFMGAEIRGVKAQRSGRESYGDNAVGYIQVKRETNICTVKAKVTPEHSLRNKAYNVTLMCNEVEEEVLSVQCDDCAASLGGCKHAIALLSWLHRRSEEPAVTSVSCYWKPSKLSTVGRSLKFIKGKNLGKGDMDTLPPRNGLFLNAVLEKRKILEKDDTVLTKYFKEASFVEKISIHHLLLNFFKDQHGTTADEFILYCSSEMSEEICTKAANETVQQSESSLWFELRYGRITASKAHEGAHCHTLDGSLVETILGATTLKDTAAMIRGRRLEKEIRRQVEKERKIKIKLCGFGTSAEYPIMGASPDGISDDCVIEIKCPSTEKAMKNYICNGKITAKHHAQIQLQMLFFKKQQGLFCVASADFENSKKISILEVDFDVQYCADIVNKCTTFWKTAIFPVLEKNFSSK